MRVAIKVATGAYVGVHEDRPFIENKAEEPIFRGRRLRKVQMQGVGKVATGAYLSYVRIATLSATQQMGLYQAPVMRLR